MSRLRVLSIAKRHAYVLRRSPHRLYDVTIWPVVDVLLFGSLGVFLSETEGGERAAFGYLLAGIVLWHVVYQSQIAMSTGFLEETWSRNLLNLLVTPLKEIEYAAGVALFGLVKLVLGVGLVALGALGFYAFDISDVGVGLIPIAAVLLVVGWAMALFVIALVLRFGSGAEALAWGILFLVMPLSGVFYPVPALPGLVQPVARLLPTTHAFAALRGLLDGRGMLWGDLGVAAAGAAVLTIAAMLFLAKMLALFRTRGYVTRYS
ncbi:MAG: ABC transporter permease [Actinomycetota bacterium]